MQAFWILPNREQGDDILASDGQSVLPLRQIIDPRRRPAGFSHGVPTELLERCGPQAGEALLFAQRFPDWNEGKQLLLVSGTAGTDATGRMVHLGLLFILEPEEQPRFDLPFAALSAQDQKYARALLDRMRSPRRGDSWAQSVRELSRLPASTGPATNVELHRSVVRFYSPNVLTADGGIRKALTRGASATKLKLLLIVCAAVASVYLGERGCVHMAHPAVATSIR
jgi:hypothetical protein